MRVNPTQARDQMGHPVHSCFTQFTPNQFTWDLECGETFNGTESGEFTSPGYPNAYTNGLLCDYKIITPPQDFVQIEFQDPFELESKLQMMYRVIIQVVP